MTTTVLLIVIAVSLVVIAVASVYTGRAAYRVYRQVTELQTQIDPHLVEFTRKQAQMNELLARIEAQQGEMSVGMQRASVAAAKLGFLMAEFSTARNRIRGY